MKHPFAKILLADSDPEFAKVARYSIESMQLEVEQATDGRAALAKAANGVKAMVLDLSLPGLDGATVVENVRKIKGPDFPVLVVTRLPIDKGWVEAMGVLFLLKGTFTLHHLAHTVKDQAGKTDENCERRSRDRIDSAQCLWEGGWRKCQLVPRCPPGGSAGATNSQSDNDPDLLKVRILREDHRGAV